MTNIKLTATGIPVGNNTRARAVDIDHATTILEYTARGYTIGVSETDGDPGWRLVCSGQDYLITRLYYYTEDARLLDRPIPSWVVPLLRWIDQTKGDRGLSPAYAIEQEQSHG